MLYLLIVGVLSQSYFLTLDETLQELLSTQAQGYQPWHPNLKVTLRIEQPTIDYYSFVQKKMKVKHRPHLTEFVQMQSEPKSESLVCKCSFSPYEGEAEAEGGEGEVGEAEGGEGEGGEACVGGDPGETEFIMKKTRSSEKDFSFLQVGQQLNSNDEIKQLSSRLLAQQQLLEQFMTQQNQLVQALSVMQANQGRFVPQIVPQVYDPNYLTPQQILMLGQHQLQQQQQPPIMGFQQNTQFLKNEPQMTEQQQQILQLQQLLQMQQQQQQQQQLLQQAQIPQQVQMPLQQSFLQQPQQFQQQPQMNQQQILQILQSMQGIQAQSQQQNVQTIQQVPQSQQPQFLQQQPIIQQQQQPVQQQPQVQQQAMNLQQGAQFPQFAQQLTQPLQQQQFTQQIPQIIGR